MVGCCRLNEKLGLTHQFHAGQNDELVSLQVSRRGRHNFVVRILKDMIVVQTEGHCGSL